jgi:DNA-binding Lrp family transcriptional regulator
MISQKNKKILDILMENCKLSTKEIGKRLGIPITTVHNHIKKMESDGIIKGYTTLVDYKQLGKNIQAFIHVSLATTFSGKTVSQQKLAEHLYELPEVIQCYIISGKTDIIMLVTAHDIEDLNNFVTQRLKKVDGVDNADISIVLSDISEKSRNKVSAR